MIKPIDVNKHETMKSSLPAVSESNLRELGANSIEEILKRDAFLGILSMDGKKIAFGQRDMSSHKGHALLREKYPFVEDGYQFEYVRPRLYLHAKLGRKKNKYSALTPEDIRVVWDVLRPLGMQADTLLHWYNEEGRVGGWVTEERESDSKRIIT